MSAKAIVAWSISSVVAVGASIASIVIAKKRKQKKQFAAKRERDATRRFFRQLDDCTERKSERNDLKEHGESSIHELRMVSDSRDLITITKKGTSVIITSPTMISCSIDGIVLNVFARTEENKGKHVFNNAWEFKQSFELDTITQMGFNCTTITPSLLSKSLLVDVSNGALTLAGKVFEDIAMQVKDASVVTLATIRSDIMSLKIELGSMMKFEKSETNTLNYVPDVLKTISGLKINKLILSQN